MKPCSTASYSFSWANSVVSKLKGNYPRATKLVEEILDIDDRNLAAFLANGDPMFPVLREFIHFCDKCYRKDRQVWDTLTIVESYRNVCVKLNRFRLVKRLDSYRERAYAQRAVEQGIPRGLIPEGNRPLRDSYGEPTRSSSESPILPHQGLLDFGPEYQYPGESSEENDQQDT